MDLENTLLLYRVAKYYYLDNYSQQEIAEMENISRSQISRLLKKAHDCGIVRIDISLPELFDKELLENKLQHMLSLKKVTLISSSSNKIENNKTLYLFAADYIKKAISNSKRIGIGWGETMYNISLNLSSQDDERERTFYALIGTSGTNNSYLQTNSIVDRFAEKFHAQAHYNNFQSCFQPDTLSELDKKRWSELNKCWSTLDTVIVGLGGSIQTGELYINEFENQKLIVDDIKKMKGDILGNFFSDYNYIYQYPNEFHPSSPKLQDIRNIKNIICVAHGFLKVDAIICAAKHRYIKELITDEITGKLILEKLQTK
jgi:deoxyribonucleoside regulator